MERERERERETERNSCYSVCPALGQSACGVPHAHIAIAVASAGEHRPMVLGLDRRPLETHGGHVIYEASAACSGSVP